MATTWQAVDDACCCTRAEGPHGRPAVSRSGRRAIPILRDASAAGDPVGPRARTGVTDRRRPPSPYSPAVTRSGPGRTVGPPLRPLGPDGSPVLGRRGEGGFRPRSRSCRAASAAGDPVGPRARTGVTDRRRPPSPSAPAGTPPGPGRTVGPPLQRPRRVCAVGASQVREWRYGRGFAPRCRLPAGPRLPGSIHRATTGSLWPTACGLSVSPLRRTILPTCDAGPAARFPRPSDPCGGGS
jgi:hypothetical protein